MRGFLVKINLTKPIMFLNYHDHNMEFTTKVGAQKMMQSKKTFKDWCTFSKMCKSAKEENPNTSK
jgi:hypothetical protein